MAKTHKGILQRPPIPPYLDLQIQGHVFVLKSGGDSKGGGRVEGERAWSASR